jgi:tetratricopeptide (TPR) repeat protein
MYNAPKQEFVWLARWVVLCVVKTGWLSMDMSGMHSILLTSATNIWSGEQNPPPELVTLFDEIPLLLMHTRKPKRREEVKARLDQLTKRELEPSQSMRLIYLKGDFFAALHDYSQAYGFYYRAFELAVEHSDFDSMIVLSVLAGNMLHNLRKYRDALEHYEVALATWYEMTQSSSLRRIEPEITLQNLISRQRWLIGEFDVTRTTLAKALTEAMRVRVAPNTDDQRYLLGQTARALWTLGLLLRGESDLLDGNVDFLRTAQRHMRKATRLFRALGAEDYQMGRFYIQIAEIYFDRAELHLQRGKMESARSARNEGLIFVESAKDFLAPSEDNGGKRLAHITHLRSRILWPQSRTTMRERNAIESDLTQIEFEAAESNDSIFIAKVATLRAEWLFTLGETTRGCESLRWAIKEFDSNGKGMATRAERLYRAHFKSASPEISFGPETYRRS